MSAPLGSADHDPEAVHEIAWGAPGIGRVIGLRFADAFGVFAVARRRANAETVDGLACLTGGLLAVDLVELDDVDVDVDLILVLDREASPSVLVGYDAADVAENVRRIAIPAGPQRWTEVTVRLPRARFAGRGPRGTDLLLAAPRADFSRQHGDADGIAVASIAVTPVGPVERPVADARLGVEIQDEHGRLTAARVGVYDAGDRDVLPGRESVPIRRYGEDVRQVALRTISAEESGPGGPREPWPHPNRWVMYVDGRWTADVPAGAYDVIVQKGPEYRLAQRRCVVEPGTTQQEIVRMVRWADPAASGWRSGDAHIHAPHGAGEDASLLALARAEGVHVANLLRMGNLAATGYEQDRFGPQGWAEQDGHHLTSGQEDPRTGRRGHTLHLNVAAPVRDPARYFLYHEAFERLRAGGAISGYAHAGTGWFDELAGLALDVPFGLVDLIEVAQAGLRTDPWYDFLNLGFRLTPVAGSDWPYINAVGTVRSYVQVGAGPTLPGWFDRLRDGRTFVSNGPLLDLSVDDAGMGEEISVEAGADLSVRGAASLNPDLGALERLELVVHGQVVASGSIESEGSRAVLDHRLVVPSGLWLALRTYGESGTFAHSAPVYVPAGAGTWRADAAHTIVTRMRLAMERLLSSEPDAWREELEPWLTEGAYEETWARLLPELRSRVAMAGAKYEELLDRIQRA